MTYRHDNDALTLMDWFCGAGGSSQGGHAIPGVRVTRAANHWERAIESHAANFPDTDHYRGDIREAPVERWPVTDLFWASPECPQWSVARGKKRDVKLRGGGDQDRALSALNTLGTVSASGNHHGVVAPPGAMLMRNNTPRGDAAHLSTSVDEPARTLTAAGHQSLVTWEHLLVPYYGNGAARPVTDPFGALSTRDHYALASPEVDINDVLFRMLEPHEIGRAMSFADEYVVVGNKRERVRQYGNAVTPNAAEVILCALVEAITGEEMDRYAQPTYQAAA